MAYQETPLRANIEFLKSSASGKGRVIRLNHTPEQVPPQLQGRVDPALWHQFMLDVETLANKHPYVIPPDAKQVGKWALGTIIGAVIGIFCLNPDGGDYNVWVQEVQHLVNQYQAAFQARGCALSLQRTREYFIAIDVNPNAPVLAQPVPKTV